MASSENYLLERRQYLGDCWKHAKSLRIVAAAMVLIALYSGITSYASAFESGNKLIDVVNKVPKIPLIWATIVFLAGLVFILIEGGYRLQQHQREGWERERLLLKAHRDIDFWQDYAEKFSDLRSDTFARWSILDGQKRWSVNGQSAGIAQGVALRAKAAGAILRRSGFLKTLRPDFVADSDDLHLWCDAIIAFVDYEMGLHGILDHESGKEEYGIIENLPNASKLLCLTMIAECQRVG